MRTVAGRYRLVSWDDLEKDDVAVPAVQALGWLGPWLADPDARAEIVEAYALTGPGGRLAIRHLTESDLHRFVRPLLERALLSGELVLVERAPIAGWKPAIMNVPSEDGGRGDAVSVAAPPPTPTKTWIEFLVTDMSGEPVADVKYEATLVDGTRKEGKTDAKGLVRFDEIDPGTVELKLVDYDGAAVETDEEGARRKAAEEKKATVAPAAGKDGKDDGKELAYVLAAAIKLIGDTPLVNGLVRIIDPDTNEPVGDEVPTDDKGEMRVEVPEKKDYRIEIVDDELEPVEDDPPPPLPDPEPASLVCRFVGPDGKPLADEPVQIGPQAGDGDDLKTDEDGRIEAPAALGPTHLKVRDVTFVAHSLPAEDAENPAYLYEFVVEPKS